MTEAKRCSAIGNHIPYITTNLRTPTPKRKEWHVASEPGFKTKKQMVGDTVSDVQHRQTVGSKSAFLGSSRRAPAHGDSSINDNYLESCYATDTLEKP